MDRAPSSEKGSESILAQALASWLDKHKEISGPDYSEVMLFLEELKSGIVMNQPEIESIIAEVSKLLQERQAYLIEKDTKFDALEAAELGLNLSGIEVVSRQEIAADILRDNLKKLADRINNKF